MIGTKSKTWFMHLLSVPWICGSFLLGFAHPFLLLADRDKDWPNWLGPSYNGTTFVEGLTIPQDGKEYPTVWTTEVGVGWSSPVIGGGSLYLHERSGTKEKLRSFDKSSGKENWVFPFATNYRDDFGMEDGPRSTPALSEDLLIGHSPDGWVHAIDRISGTLKWKVDLVERFGAGKGFFGRCSSPLILDSKVIVEVGGNGVGVVAMDLQTGSVLWKTSFYGNDYASPVPFFSAKGPWVVCFVREGLLAIDAEDGKTVHFESFRAPIDASVHAASPVVFDDRIFLSACYSLGSGLWEITNTGNGRAQMKALWKRPDLLDSHYATPVQRNGFIYGFHGRQERRPVLRCLGAEFGKVAWSSGPLPAGNLVLSDDKLVILLETGELLVVEATPSRFTILHRQQILGSGTRAHFALAGNQLYARDKRRLVCVDLSKAD